jgi:chorismate mutase
MSDPVLESLRDRVAETDREILELVNRRVDLVDEIRRHKETNGVPFFDAGQEERLLARLREANSGPLSDGGVERLFREILDLVKTELG